MERNRMLKPEELGTFTAALIRALQTGATDEGKQGPPERSRLRPEVDQARRQRDEEALRRDAAERRARIVASVLEHVIPPKVYDLVTSSKAFKSEVATTALDWWDAGHPRVLVLRGGIGVGKTVAAGIVAKHAVENGYRSVSWHRPNDFVSGMLHAYDDEAPTIGQDLVVIDDMGRETKSDFVEALSTFLDARRTRLIITTNDSLQTWRVRYTDPRLIDRLGEEGESYTIAGESMRQKGWGF